MPLKLFGALLLSLSGFALGCMFVQRLKLRRSFFREFSVFLNDLSTSMRYRSESIIELVNSCGELFCISSEEAFKPFSEIWQNQIKAFPKRWRLKSEDMAMLKEFGDGLGITDAEGQLSHIELYKTMFAKQQKEAEDDISQKAKLYKTLGLFAGVSTALMLL